MVQATVPKSTSKVLYNTSKVPQQYFKGNPRYYESTVRYFVNVFKGILAVLQRYLAVRLNIILRRPNRVETVQWCNKHRKVAFIPCQARALQPRRAKVHNMLCTRNTSLMHLGLGEGAREHWELRSCSPMAQLRLVLINLVSSQDT